jgi:probable phosphoglycerate mutase
MVTQIFLIRHGETAWSLTGQHTGHTDLPLTKNGELRAARLRGLLQGIKFTHVFTSPLQRARRTCELAGFGAMARIEPDLHELDYGNYEGRTTADIHLEHPGWAMFKDGSPQGESVQKFSERADRILAIIHSMDGEIALFSHGQFLRALAARWIGLPVQEGQHFALDTASVSILGYEHTNEETPAITLWNVVANKTFALSFPPSGEK